MYVALQDRNTWGGSSSHNARIVNAVIAIKVFYESRQLCILEGYILLVK